MMVCHELHVIRHKERHGRRDQSRFYKIEQSLWV